MMQGAGRIKSGHLAHTGNILPIPGYEVIGLFKDCPPFPHTSDAKAGHRERRAIAGVLVLWVGPGQVLF